MSIVATLVLAFIFAGDAVGRERNLSENEGARVTAPEPYLPVPSARQLQWHDLDTYAFIHYSLNTYTDKEWGYGNESPSLFNPSDLDCRQWARVCRQAGMRGIIFTAKHHCGFCLWPSRYTNYSVGNSPWKQGKGDVVRELAEACHREGLKFAVYLSPWDRNHPDYGKPEYITYFRNQLRELLTEYGPMFEVWFDGANGGNGWYGGADETRHIDKLTYYHWDETFDLVRKWQPALAIWGDTGHERADIRWVGTEKGFVGLPNWNLLPAYGDITNNMRQHGVESGWEENATPLAWVPGEVDVSIRPGWFYHKSEDDKVRSLENLMKIYYQSVGRGASLILNFPVMPNGRIHPTDSLRGSQFGQAVRSAFKHDLARKATLQASNVRGRSKQFAPKRAVDGSPATYWATDDSVRQASLTLTFKRPTAVNRFLVEEPIALGQRISRFSLEYWSDGQWKPLRDEFSEDNDSALTTIGHRRILCFPTVTATRLRFTVLDSKACPLISRISLYCAE